ncbi:hypothetical protein [Bartonella sp. ML70XJBT]|uniref:hypothetical protein n=1 Tax=Bartonella sp. ML70XJBT TaxID=3019096 RepID=UPI002362D5CD|nr:hypothetical protein [Bartonella sp. ML70XJBT]
MDFREIFKAKITKNEIHIEYTTLKHICNCNKKAYEKIEKGKTENALPSKNNKSLQIKPEFLTEALPNVAMFMKYGLQSERDLIGSMEFLAKMKGISSHAIKEAKKQKSAFFV